MSPARLLELLHGMSEEDQATFKRNMGRTEVTTCPLLRVTILLVFVLKTQLKRRIFNLFKPGEKCLRSAFGSREWCFFLCCSAGPPRD